MDITPYKSAMADCASLLSVAGLPPLDPALVPAWQDELRTLLEDCAADAELTEGQIETRQEVLETFMRVISSVKQTPSIYDIIKSHHQVPQRTPEWYALRSGALSATNIPNLFASPRQYALMVHEKCGLIEKTTGSSRPAAETAYMTPFDWGIRFEPCLRQCMEKVWGQPIEEVGCIAHADPAIRLVASPDGLMATGSLVEFKCPVSRAIGGKIPTDYWQQMQIQMEVTGAEECQYVEAVFRSAAPTRYETPIGPALPYSGTIHLYREAAAMEVEGEPPGQLLYDYDAKHPAPIEVIPWELFSYMHVKVARDRAWFATEVLPRIQKFWEDCDLARAGKFPIPQGRKRAAKCEIEIDVEAAAAPLEP